MPTCATPVADKSTGGVDSNVGTFRAASLTLLSQMVPLKRHKNGMSQSSSTIDDEVNAYIDAHCHPTKVRNCVDKCRLASEIASEDPGVARILEARRALGDDAWLPPEFERNEATRIVTPTGKKQRGSTLGDDPAFCAAAIGARQVLEQKAHDMLSAAWAASHVP